eukprot:3660674-Pleurochrysis_carterae.AAC.1
MTRLAKQQGKRLVSTNAGSLVNINAGGAIRTLQGIRQKEGEHFVETMQVFRQGSAGIPSRRCTYLVKAMQVLRQGNAGSSRAVAIGAMGQSLADSRSGRGNWHEMERTGGRERESVSVSERA